MTETLLQTKFHIPSTRPNRLPRQRLINQLNQGLQMGCRLVLISAPAGFGKTTLLSEWADQQGIPVAYLALDETDNDLKRFLAYFVAALQMAAPHLGDVVRTMLQAPEPIVPDTVLTPLINETVLLSHPLVLIIDDLHLITAGDIHHSLTYLLEHMPPQLHLVLATRADPPLPLAKLRAKGQMAELREADLRFTHDEAEEFLRHIMDVKLASQEIAILHGRTEGWAAGLQMAALSMQGREQMLDFIDSFSGTHEYVVDYLTGEVLARQTDVQETFLLQTSILDRLCGPLCDAVTGQAGSRQRLEQLKAANLFIISLDDERRWYRYHRLFADLLQQRLFNQQPEIIPELHRRAGGWLEANGFPFAAIHHILQAGDYDRAADLIAEVVKQPSSWATLNATMLMAWLECLPAPLLQERPYLRLYQARVFTVQGQAQRADVLLQALDEELRGAGPGNEDLREQISADRVSNAILQGEPLRAIDYAEQALAQLALENLPAQMRLEAILAMACSQVGQVKRAGRAYNRALAAAQTVGIPVVTASLKTGMAKVNILKGCLCEAARDCAEACRLAEVQHKRTAVAGPALVTWAEILVEQNELEQAGTLLAQGIDLLHKQGPVHALSTAHAVQARLQQAAGHYEEAFKSLHQAAQLAKGLLSARILAQQVRLCLVTSNLAAAENWAEDYRQGAPGEYLHDFEELTLARVFLGGDHSKAALSLLEMLLAEAEPAGRQGSLVEILALQALALAADGEVGEALRSLARSLALARPEGYVRIYIDEEQPMASLLAQMTAAGQETQYAQQLLAAMPMVEPAQPLIEPLSPRESEVLQLIEQGLSNRQIAQQLVISLPTVKSHTGNIYSKLGVSSRTQAVSQARALQIL